MKRVILSYIFLYAFGISTILNILYISNIVSEVWFRLGFVVVMILSVAVNITPLFRKNSEKNKEKLIQSKINKKDYIYFVLSIIIGLLWIITYLVAVFIK